MSAEVRGARSGPEPMVSKDHWDQSWQRMDLPRINDSELLTQYHELFTACLNGRKERADYLEIGCAASAWMPYFHKYQSCNVFGFDYSAGGVELARRNLELQGIAGQVVIGDLLTQDRIFDRQFDVVASYGFVEHFRRPDEIIKRMSRYLKSNGLFITGIPNLNGIFGDVLRCFRKDLFAIHNPMSLESLIEHHESAGLTPCPHSTYIGGLDLKMLASPIVRQNWPGLVRAGIATTVHHSNRLAYVMTRKLRSKSIREYLAPDVLVICTKP